MQKTWASTSIGGSKQPVSHSAAETSSLNKTAAGIAPRATLYFQVLRSESTACSVCSQHGVRRTVVSRCKGDGLTQGTRENYIMRTFIILHFTLYY